MVFAVWLEAIFCDKNLTNEISNAVNLDKLLQCLFNDITDVKQAANGHVGYRQKAQGYMAMLHTALGAYCGLVGSPLCIMCTFLCFLPFNQMDEIKTR